jgi:hypothetical protein
METTFQTLPTFAKLRDHVHQRLCSCDHLDPNQTPMDETLIQKAGKPCGVTFTIRGPRMLRLHAIWAAQEKRVLFYDSTGKRFGETRLVKSPDLKTIAA